LPSYKLFNKDNERELVHPKIGTWNTEDIEEARGMRDSFRDYLRTLELHDYCEDIVILDIETSQEIV